MSCLLILLRVGEIPQGVAEALFQSLLEFLTGLSCLEVAVLHILQVEVIHNESGWHDVTLVHVFHERLDTGALDELLLAKGSLDLAEIEGDPSH